MAIRRIKEFLDGNDVRYAIIRHSPAYTAAEVAQSIHVPGRAMAKVVIAKIHDRLAMVVLPATREVDFNLLQRVAGERDVRLACEAEFASRFEGCQLGTAPPFGNLFGMETYVDRSLSEQEYIAFNAGTHVEVMAMKFADYQRLVHPDLVHIEMAPLSERFNILSV